MSWKASLQAKVALLATEVESIVVMEVVKETTWLRGLYSEFINQEEVTIIHQDSLGAIHLMEDPMHYDRTKHINMMYHFDLDIIDYGDV